MSSLHSHFPDRAQCKHGLVRSGGLLDHGLLRLVLEIPVAVTIGKQINRRSIEIQRLDDHLPVPKRAGIDNSADSPDVQKITGGKPSGVPQFEVVNPNRHVGKNR